jgi:CHAT domain-containing protein
MASKDGNLPPIELARSLRRQGFLFEAETCLKACLDDPSDLINLELGHIHILRGYYKYAVEHLEPLAPGVYTKNDNIGTVALRLQLSSAKIETAGKIKEAKALVADVWRDILQSDQFQLSHEGVWIAIYYAHIIFLLDKYGEGKDSVSKTSMQGRLAAIQHQAEDLCWMHEAFEILRYRIFGLKPSECQTALKYLCSLSEDPSIQAECHYELSRSHRSVHAFGEAEVGLLVAEEHFKACAHAFGLIDIRLDREVNRKPASVNTITALHEMREQYHGMDFPEKESTVLANLGTCFVELGNYDSFYDAQNELTALYDRSGARLLHYHTRIKTLAQALVQTGRLGAIVEGCTTLTEELISFQAMHLASTCAITLSLAYIDLSQLERSIEYAQLAIFIAVEAEDFEVLSMGVRNLASVQEHQARLSPSASAYEKPIRLLSDQAAKDGEHGYIDHQVEKYQILASLETKRAEFITKPEAQKNALEWLAKAAAAIQKLPEQQQAEYTATIEYKRSTIYNMLDDLDSACRCLQSACASFDKMGKLREATTMRESIAQNRLLTHYAKEPTNVDLLNHALESWYQVQTALQSSDKKEKLAKCHYQQAQIWQRAHELGDKNALRHGLEDLETAERIRNEIRLELSTMPEIETLSLKQALVGHGTAIHALGLDLYLQANDVKGAWSWLQRGKARALMDLLGLGVIIPAGIQQAAEKNEDTRKLLKWEATFLEELHSSQPGERFEVRRNLADLRAGMAKIAGLREIVALRGGDAVALEDLETIFDSTPNVVCIDWAIQKDSVFLFSVRPGENPNMRRLDVSVDEIKRWKRNYYNKEELQTEKANTWLRKLDGLISPLADLARDEDLLILSPTGPLTAFPLHALRIKDTLLLERHAVIYTPSLAILRHCINRRSPDSSADEGKPTSSICIFGDPTKNRSSAAISSTSLASAFNTTAFVHDSASASNFLEHAPNSRVIHYHGHASYNADDPLESYLKLSTGNITSRDFFSLPLCADLVTLIACDSSNHSVGVGDEPSGLLPALLYAGANAVVGTLWPLWDKVGGEFVHMFYKCFADELSTVSAASESGEERKLVVNLAQALRKSVLQIRKERPAPYFWALFVLNGNWIYRGAGLA